MATTTRTTDAESLWQAARQVVLDRDGRRCVECGEVGNLHVHHRVPRYLGGADEPANLITLCAACHAARHPNLQIALSRPFIERWAIRLARWLDTAGELPAETDALHGALRLLNKNEFREGQLEVVLAALRGESLLAVRPTGSGKTLCYQLPSLLRPGTAYVLSPLKALMADQVSDLQRQKVPGTFINSDLPAFEKRARYELLDQQAVKFLYVTPERFDPTVVRDRGEIERLARRRPSFLVVDEAHCVDRWGNDFRPSYGRLGEVRATLGDPPVLAFTATAGIKAQRRILDGLGIPDARVFVTGVDRPNIALIRHEPASRAERFQITRHVIASTKGRVMIFVPTRKVGEEVRAGLVEAGLEVPFYHGQLPQVEREFLLGRFSGRIQPGARAIICTNAFGMGIDITDVRAVIHWVQPESIEDYLQELGRGGRDGKPALALIFKWDRDTGIRTFIAERTLEEAQRRGVDGEDAYRRKLESIDDLDRMIRNRRVCFRKQIVDAFEAGGPRRRSWSIRILEWLLGRRIGVEKAAFCCDACDRGAAAAALGLTR